MKGFNLEWEQLFDFEDGSKFEGENGDIYRLEEECIWNIRPISIKDREQKYKII